MATAAARSRTPVAAVASPNGWPIWGNDEAVRGLRREMVLDRVAHAYVMAGPEGVGKTAVATMFAQAICCQDGSRSDRSLPCRSCLACRKIARGVHPDVETFGLASQEVMAEKGRGGKQTTLTIDSVRRLSSASALHPMEARRRLILIEDAETMQEVAQEALLKTLEEPPAAVVIVLLTDEADALLPTIRSRCRLVDLRPVGASVVAAALVAGGVEAGRAEEIAALAGGRPGWGVRAAAEPALLNAARDGVERALDWVAGSPYDRLVAAVRLGDGFTKRRAAVLADLDTLLGVWRDALLLRVDLPLYLTHRGYAERLSELVDGWELDAVRRAICAVQTCISDLESNVRPRLAIEAMVLQWPISSRRR